jgi:hypothetical protein
MHGLHGVIIRHLVGRDAPSAVAAVGELFDDLGKLTRRVLDRRPLA